MVKQNKKPFWQRIDEKLGFYHDERTQRVQLEGVRYSYIVAAILLPSLAAYQQFWNGQTGIFWIMLTAVLLTLLFLLLRRYQLGGTAPADERVQQQLNRNYRHAYSILLLSLGAYMGYILFTATQTGSTETAPGVFWWTLAMPITLIPIFIRHRQQHTYSITNWRVLVLTLLIVLSLTYVIGFFIGSSLP